ncbi:MAG: DUF4178 domain-containing protein [Pseudomonadota bacterium]
MNCPVCGAAVPGELKYAKLVVCEHCKTSLFLEDESVKDVGVKSALTEMHSIFELGRRYAYRGKSFEMEGRVRYDYGNGLWDEWWARFDDGNGRWVSVDEGDIAIQAPQMVDETPPPFDRVSVGQYLRIDGIQLTVTEKNEAHCVGLEGRLPEVVMPGDSHQYLHLSGPRGLLYTVEYEPDAIDVHRGNWVDPFDVRAL